jgi:hypothetical protein
MASAGLIETLEQLVWLQWETACAHPFYFLATFVLPLAALAILGVRNTTGNLYLL